MTAFNIIKSLTKRGNVVLGAGCYAAVLNTTTDKVLKVGNSVCDPWLDYYNLVIRPLKGNPHVPATNHLHVDNDFNYYVCSMERLEPVTFDTARKEVTSLCEEYVKGWFSEEEFVKQFTEQYSSFSNNINELVVVLNTIKEYTQSFTKSSEDDIDYNARTLDMHRGNFMLRDGILVITDPWCELDMSEIESVEDWLHQTSDYSSNY
jgi:hypothetical protein